MKRILSVLLVAIPAFSQQLSRIDVADGRPIAQVIDNFERLSGIPVHYEDARYEYAGDIEDVSAQVRKPEYRGAPTRLVLVPKTRSLSTTFFVGSDGRLGNQADLERALAALMASSHTSGMPGSFRIDTYGQNLFFVPTDVRGVDGSTKPNPSVLATLVTVKVSKMNGLEALDVILKAISKASGQKVEIGQVPFGSLASTQFSTDSQGRPAADVLTELLSKLQGRNAIRMFYGPDVKYYAFNMHPVLDLAKGPEQPAQPPPPSTNSPWGKATGK